MMRYLLKILVVLFLVSVFSNCVYAADNLASLLGQKYKEIETLKAALEPLEAENESLKAENQALKAENEALKAEVEQVKQKNKELALALSKVIKQPEVKKPEVKQPKKPAYPSSMSITKEEVQVWIKSVSIKQISMSDGLTTSRSRDPLLSITVGITNLKQNKKINYKTWAGQSFSFGRDFATAKDNFDNSYKRITFGLMETVEGSTDNESIYPQTTIYDVLVFEKPISGIDYIEIELPAKNFGGSDMLTFRIPKESIENYE